MPHFQSARLAAPATGRVDYAARCGAKCFNAVIAGQDVSEPLKILSVVAKAFVDLAAARQTRHLEAESVVAPLSRRSSPAGVAALPDTLVEVYAISRLPLTIEHLAVDQ